MSLKFRFFLLLAGLATAFAGALWLLQHTERSEKEDVLAASREEEGARADHWIDLAGVAMQQFVDDYSWWDDMVEFVHELDPEWAETNLYESLEAFKVSAMWVADLNGKVLYGTGTESWEEAPFPITAEELKHITDERPHARFFHLTDAGLVELRTAPVQPSGDNDRVTPPQGWFIAARLWDDDFLGELAGAMGGTATLQQTGDPEPPDRRNPAWIVTERPIRDETGAAIATLRIDRFSNEIAVLQKGDSSEAAIVIAFGLLVLGSMTVALQRWVIGPLGEVSQRLAAGESPLPDSQPDLPPEWRKVTELVDSWFQQQSELQSEVARRHRIAEDLKASEVELRRNIEERIRLGRDLHDSVIQAVYAAGMGLAGARNLLRNEPAEAEERLETVQRRLNETIRELRQFITGLEPEHSDHATFGDSISHLIDYLRAIGPLETEVEIDEEAAEDLSPFARANALHIVREAVSNALRHGNANHIRLGLSRADDTVELTIVDNGTGFDPAKIGTPGRGLENMRERAEAVNGSLEIKSAHTKGTRIRLMFKVSDQ